MLTKICDMQKFLWLNAELPFGKGRIGLSELGENRAFSYFALFLFLGVLSPSSDINYFILAVFSAAAVAYIIGKYANRNRIIITMIPSGRVFKFLNMYLLGFLLIIAFCLAMVIWQYFGIIIIHAVAYLLKNQKMKSEYVRTTTEIFIFSLIIVTVLYVELLTLMFIKNAWIRNLAVIVSMILFCILMSLFGKNIASRVNVKDTGDLLLNFQQLPNKVQFLTVCGAGALAVSAVFMFFGYLLCRGKRSM